VTLAPLALPTPDASQADGLTPEGGVASDLPNAGIFAELIGVLENAAQSAGDFTALLAQCAGKADQPKLNEPPGSLETLPELDTASQSAAPLDSKSPPVATIQQQEAGPLQLGLGEKKAIGKNEKKEEGNSTAWISLSLGAAQQIRPEAPAPLPPAPAALAGTEATLPRPESSFDPTEAQPPAEFPKPVSLPESEAAASRPLDDPFSRTQLLIEDVADDFSLTQNAPADIEPGDSADFSTDGQPTSKVDVAIPVAHRLAPEVSGEEPPRDTLPRDESAAPHQETKPDAGTNSLPAPYPVPTSESLAESSEVWPAAPEQRRASAAERQPFASNDAKPKDSLVIGPRAMTVARVDPLPAIGTETKPSAAEPAFTVRISQWPPAAEQPPAALRSSAEALQQKTKVLFSDSAPKLETNTATDSQPNAPESRAASLPSNEHSHEKVTEAAALGQKNRERLSTPPEVSSIEQPAPDQPASLSGQPTAASPRLLARQPADAIQAQMVEAKPVNEPAPTPKQLRIRLQPGNEQPPVDVHVRESSGQVQVAVRTPNDALAAALRERLPELAAELDRRGYGFEIWRPQPLAAARQAAVMGSETANVVMGAWRGGDSNAGGTPDFRHPQNEFEFGSGIGGERRHSSDRQPEERKKFSWEWLEQ